VLLAGCGKYGEDDAAADPNVNANTQEPGSDGSDSAADPNDNAVPGADDATGTPADGSASEGAPDVDRGPTDGETTPEGRGETTPEGEGETTPEGDPEVVPEDPVVVIEDRPCDIYESGGTPCVAAYSMVRVLSAGYTGPLYQVRRGAPNPFMNTGVGGDLLDIGFTPEGYADAAAQDAFCGNQTCSVSVLYDQSPLGNDLVVALGGCYDGGVGDDGPAALQDDYESDAKRQPISIGGRRAYGLYTNEHEGYRNDEAVGTAEGTEAQGIYMVADGTHSGPACCFDFGNASRERCYGPTGIMSALFLGTAFWGWGAGNGPWMMGDFELGVWAGGDFPSFGLNALFGLPPSPPPNQAQVRNLLNPSLNVPFAFGALTTEVGNYSLRMGNATSGNLTTAYDGPTQITWDLDGAIILGIGGDNSNWSWGTFYEGAMTAGRPLPGIEAQIYQNVRAAGYGQ
jgi:hypothetical protein